MGRPSPRISGSQTRKGNAVTYEQLTDEQKQDLATYDRYLRGVMSSLAGVARQADIATWNQFAQTNIDPWLPGLDAASGIPTDSGLGQAKTLTAAEFRDLQALARQLAGMLDANRALLVKSVGVNA
jgi:hypothetical protein